MEFIFLRDLVWGIFWRAVVIALVVALALCCATKVFAEEPEKDSRDDPANWVKGGLASRANTGDCFYKAFVKVGDAEDHPDDGHAQIWGYSPGNVQISKITGKVIWERADEKRFAKRDMPAKGCAQKCPMFNE